jgi:hypothetical protein
LYSTKSISLFLKVFSEEAKYGRPARSKRCLSDVFEGNYGFGTLNLKQAKPAEV